MSLSYIVDFVAKTESASSLTPQTYPSQVLKGFCFESWGGSLICLVRAVAIYLDRTSDLSRRPRSLFCVA